MTNKITLSTPPHELYNIVMDEGKKARLWYLKKMGGEKKADDACMALSKSIPQDKFNVIRGNIVEYTPASGNYWIAFQTILFIPGRGYITSSINTLCITTTDCGIRAYMTVPPRYTDKGCESAAIILTEQFFYDYGEIKGITPSEDIDSKDIVTDLFLNIIQFLYDNDNPQSDIHYLCCIDGAVGFGKHLSDNPLVAEINKMIPTSSMTQHQLDYTEQIRKSFQEYSASFTTSTQDDLRVQDDVMYIYNNIKKLKDIARMSLMKHQFKDIPGTIEENCTKTYDVFVSCVKKLKDMAEYEVPASSIAIDEFAVDAILSMISTSESHPGKMEASLLISLIADTCIAIAHHNNINLSEQEVREYVSINYDHNSLAKYEKLKKLFLMNQQSTSVFKNLLSRQGLTKKFSKYSSSIDDNSDRYLQRVESLYVISRFLPSIVDIKDKEKFTACNKLWLSLVVENAFSPQLKDYIEQYGRQSVSDAIEYLIDNDCWISPVDKKGLKNLLPANFEGLKDIPAAIECLKEQRKQTTQEEQSEAVIPLAVIPVDDVPSDEVPNTSDVHNKYNAACLDVQSLIDSIATLQQKANSIHDYLTMQDAASLYREEVEQISANFQTEKQKLQEEKNLLTREINDLTEQIKVSQQKLHQEERNRKAAEENAFLARQERKEALEQRDKAVQESRRLNEELEKSREQLKTHSLPTKKVLTYSELVACPIIGPSAVKSLQSLFEKRGIMIDYNH